MNLIRWSPSPARSLTTLHDEVDRLFDTYFGPSRRPVPGEGPMEFVPPVDVEETKDEFLFRADLPGVSAKDVKVSAVGDTLTIRGERRIEKREGMHRVERVHGSFERTFSLGTPFRQDGITATYRDGVLEIRVPKAEEAKLKEIQVQVAA